MSHTLQPGAGLRRYDESAARAEQLAGTFAGLPRGATPGTVLSALKRAAPYLGFSPRLVHTIDTLFAWSRPLDWLAGSVPIVWPSNDTLARKLGVGVRRAQKLLDDAVAAGLITHRDSPNGHRGGARSADGRLAWAYGVVLSPMGARLEEFQRVAADGEAADARLKQLRRRLSSARRKIRELAQAVQDAQLNGLRADEEVALAQLAVAQVRGSRDEELLAGCVEQIENRARRLELAVMDRLGTAVSRGFSPEDSCAHGSQATRYTTTIDPLTASAVTSSGSARSSSRGYDVRISTPQTEVEEDLAQHGVDPDFISDVAPELCSGFQFGRPKWGDVIAIAERLVDQAGIRRHAWHEACRLMGQKGAAASVIATAYKHALGEVRQPGAYLRGMSQRAADGELNLGRTFHGFKDGARSARMAIMATGSDPQSVGQLLARAMRATGARETVGTSR